MCFIHKGEGRKHGMNNQEAEEEIKYKTIRMETDRKTSHWHSAYNMPGTVLGALQALTWDVCTCFSFINGKKDTWVSGDYLR